MSGRGGRHGPPAFSGRTGGRGRITSLQARDAGPGGGRGRGKWKKPLNGNYMSNRDTGPGGGSKDESNARLAQARNEDELEASLGFPLFTSGEDKLGWLMNIHTSCTEDKDSGHVASAVDLYFMQQDGGMFKARVMFAPYFYLQVSEGRELEVEGYLRKRFEGAIQNVEVVAREDLDLKNHLAGIQRQLLKLSFWNTQQLLEVRREVGPAVQRNKARAKTVQAYTDMAAMQGPGGREGAPTKDALDYLVDMREYDVPYHVRFAIDKNIRCGHWFTVRCKDGVTSLEHRSDLLQRAEPRICAWDIETTKLPLQFPNAEYDQVFMISYMLDKQGYLITNREVVGGDISDFEFTPKPEYEGPFIIFNEANEEALLRRFFGHMKEVKPSVFVTYNGDFFDFPFVEKRAAVHGMDLYQELGFKVAAGGEVLARHAVHMDCLHWVNRDSYLPQGSRGLKAVTKAKLGYDPVEVDPEDMLRMAAESPQAMASYSVSDAVSTYYLYMTYIHPFIFSLATIIPLPPDEVLRKGSGTLCEQLLMVQAFMKNIVCPNKHVSEAEVFYKGHLLESETYIGGRVEAIEAGVFRSDLPLRFRCTASAYQRLLDRLDNDLGYAIKHEGKMQVEDITNYQEVKEAIAARLTAIRDNPVRDETPLIYHLDVAAMYPNIILTNRLQPSAIVTDEDCAACDFNKPGKTCLRQMEWIWRGEHYAATRNEYLAIKNQLQAEVFPPVPHTAAALAAASARGELLPLPQPRGWEDLNQEERAKLITERLKKYAQKVYKRVLDKPVTEQRVAGICQRENSFYVDTVRAFRDRRYEYKGLNKVWKGKLESAKAEGAPLRIQEAADMVVLYDSLQLAHKCILNSFYGYVMRKGARWYSMEMAGVVTYTGANIIQNANAMVTQLGRPLELDTDGIWCALPGSFPENFKFKNKNGKDLKISYPCVMLNVMVADHNTNPQYQTLVDPVTKEYKTSSEMSIEFEVDGPYKAMVLPASKEEGKSIKKRYAVFNDDGTLAELKGFEIKRRGELKLIKVFQAEVFQCFLAGSTLQQCYQAVASVANRWLDMLDTQGVDLTNEELIEYISEATTMSKGLEEYEGRKSCPITCAKRLGQFLGDERIKDKGLNCKYIIAKKPENQPTSERAIPVSIFSAEPAVARTYLRQWCGDVGSAPSHCVPDVRDIVDWEYYKERLGSAIQKIITIPAAMQGISNPCPRVKHPDWLQRKVAAMNSKTHQLSIRDLMPKIAKKALPAAVGTDVDMEDTQAAAPPPVQPATLAEDVEGDMDGAVVVAGRRNRPRTRTLIDEDDAADVPTNGKDTTAADRTGAPEAKAVAGGAGKAVAGAQSKPKPALADGYKPWMDHQKEQWKQQREQRKRRRAELVAAQKTAGRGRAGDAGAPQLGPNPHSRNDVGAMMRQRTSVITNSTWQVLQFAETRTPGRFKMWFLANNQVHHVHVVVPRVFYIDSDIPLDSDALGAQALAAAAAAGGVAGSQGQPSSQLQAVLGGLRDAACVKAGAKVLPGGRKPVHLYQVSLSEGQYLSHVTALSAVLSAPYIRGLYEERMPLALGAVLRLGSITKLTSTAANKPLAADFVLSDFQGAAGSSSSSSYLDSQSNTSKGPNAMNMLLGQQRKAQQEQPPQQTVPDMMSPLGTSLKHAVLYCSGDAAQVRATFCLFMPQASRCVVVVVQPNEHAAREVSSSYLDRTWRDAYTARCQEQGVPVGSSKVDMSVEYALDTLEAGRVLNHALKSHRSDLRGRLVVVVQGSTSSSAMAATFLPALAECPCVDLPPHADDSRYPPLQWQTRAARRALNRVLEAGVVLSERVALARYAGVPLAHLAADVSVSVADLMFARTLRASDHLLWIVDNQAPDLGVEDKDDSDAQLSCLVAGLGATVTTGPVAGAGGPGGAGLGAAGSPEVVAPGAYRSVCVELRVNHLAVAALLQAATLGDLEGTSSVEGAGGPAGPAFTVLKNLVNGWLNDATNNMNPIADYLLLSLYRWLSWPGSALYDPALHRALQGVMAKLFAQLVSEMRKLGAVLVSANFNRIIIATGKRDLPSAVGYTRYLVEALKRRELFGWLDLVPQAWWHSLLFRDAYNWAGIHAVPEEEKAAGTGSRPSTQQAAQTPARTPVKSRTGGGSAGATTPGSDGEGAGGTAGSGHEDGSLRYQWSLVTYLPEALQEELIVLFSEFLYNPWREAGRAARAQAQEGAEEGAAAGAANGQEDPQVEWLLQAVPNQFTQQLLQVVGEAARLMPVGSDEPKYQFPQQAGSHLSPEELGSPALAFVRVACHVLALDQRCSDAVAVLRRQLLRLLHVREFSPQADFKELCLALTLPDVICSYCNDCRDLDLCRDAELLAQGAAGTGWHCRQCQQAYDMAAMERRLMGALQQHVRDYQLQDLQCVRCRAVASSHLKPNCAQCGNNLALTTQAGTLRKRLTVFSSVAHHHGFPALQDLSQWLIDH